VGYATRVERSILLCSLGIAVLAVSSRVRATEDSGVDAEPSSREAAQDDSSEAGDGDDPSARSESSDEARAERGKHSQRRVYGRSNEADSDAHDASSLGHAGQFSLRAGLVGGMRVIMRYEQSPFCADPTKDEPGEERTLCGHASPLALDLGAGYAAIDGFEPFLWARLGLAAESQTDTKPLVVLGGGARLYAMSDSAFKVLIEPAFGVELEGGGDEPAWQLRRDTDYRTDLLFHLAAGPHYDFTNNFGAYLDAGVTLGVLRALHATMEAQLGVQGRYP
jgi:hypothetical protein